MLTLLVNAGPTREYFDSVRFISNPSTGKQGYAIAAEAGRRGHRVHLVSGPVALDPPQGVDCVQVTSADEMSAACKRCFEECDAAVLTAAVCDYRPPNRLTHKLQKRREPFSVALEPTEDIAAALGAAKGRRVIVGFAMNDVDGTRHAERKLAAKQCDAIVLNGLENVGAEQASVRVLLRDGGWQEPFSGSKTAVARMLLDYVERACNR